MRAIGFAQIGGDFLARAARRADFGDDGLGLIFSAAVVNEHLCAGLASARALARPMPREAPVTSAVFPVRVFMIVLPCR